MCVRVCKVRPYVGQSFPPGYICGEVCPNQISDAVSKHLPRLSVGKRRRLSQTLTQSPSGLLNREKMIYVAYL